MNKYIGLPYKNLGRDFDGVDCYGLFWLIYKEERGILLPDFTELLYDKEWYKTENHIVDNINELWTKVSVYKKYDAMIFFNSGSVANHIGTYVGDDKFIHITENSTSMISRLDGYWSSKIYEVIRYNG